MPVLLRLRCRRNLARVLAVALAATLLGVAVPAAATPLPRQAVVINGSAAAVGPASPDVALTYSIAVASGPVDDAVLTLGVPAGVRAIAGSVRFAADAVPANQLDVSTTGVTVRLGHGASARHGGSIPVGRSTVTLLVDAHAAGSAPSIAARISYTADGRAGTASADAVALPVPDVVVQVPADSGEDRTLPLQAGETGDFVVEVFARRTPSPSTTLTITLPTGLTIDDDFGVQRFSGDKDRDLTCRNVSVHVTTCALGRVDNSPQFVDIPLRAGAPAKVGSVGRFTVSARADSGLEAKPANNSVTGSVRFVGSVHLKVTITPRTKSVVVGHSTRLRITIANLGNLPATEVYGVIGAFNRLDSLRHDHFVITGFTGRVVDLFGSSAESGSGSASVPVAAAAGSPQRTLVRRSTPTRTAATRPATRYSGTYSARSTSMAALADQPLPVIAWNVGTIAPGRSASAVLTVRARAVGRGVVAAVAFSDDLDVDDCADPQLADCDEIALAQLTAVAPTSPASPAGGATEPIAATGAPTGELTAFGLLALLVGFALLWAGRPDRARRHPGGPAAA